MLVQLFGYVFVSGLAPYLQAAHCFAFHWPDGGQGPCHSNSILPLQSAVSLLYTFATKRSDGLMQLNCHPVLWLAKELNIERECPQS